MPYIENDCHDPRFNLAAEETLFLRAEREPVLSLWRNDNTVVIGRHQNYYAEINERAVRARGVTVVRRVTGGGAVYHDLGNVNFTVIAPESKRGCDFRRFTEPVAAALRHMGVGAEVTGRNDIAVGGKKVSGNAQYIAHGRVLHHGTLLFASDLRALSECLAAPKEKLARHGVASVASRVGNICEHADLNINDFMAQLRARLMEAYGVSLARALSEEEREAALRLCHEKYADPKWTVGEACFFEHKRARRFEGCGTATVEYALDGGVITRCRVTGDFFGAGDLRELEALLIGVMPRAQAVCAALAGVDVGRYVGGLKNEDFCGLFG